MDRVELRKAFFSRIVKFRLEQFGLEVNLRALTGSDRAKAQAKSVLVDKSKEADNSLEIMTKELISFVISRGLIDESGNRLYGDDEVDKVADEMPGAAMDEIFSEILSISRLNKTNLEETAKNSSPSPSESSSSGLQPSSDAGTLTGSSES
jgi:hypothetical protein